MNDRLRRRQSGSALLIAVGALAVISVGAALSLSRYVQNARAIRTSGSKTDINEIFHSVQQSLSNPNVCSSALKGTSFVNVATGTNPLSVSVRDLVYTPDGGNSSPMIVARPGMVSNGVGIPSLAQMPSGSSPILLTGGNNYLNYGTQPAPGPSGVAGLNCSQVSLHLTATRDIASIPSAAGVTSKSSSSASVFRATMGNQLLTQDIPLAILTDGANTIQSCFSGSAANICSQASSYAVTTPIINKICIDDENGSEGTNVGGPGTVTWTLSPAYPAPKSVTLTCGGQSIPVAPSQYASGGVMIYSPIGGNSPVIPAGSGVACQLTVVNSADVTSLSGVSLPFQSAATTCVPPHVSIAFAGNQSCANSGDVVNLIWSDSNTTPSPLTLMNVVQTTPGPTAIYSGSNLNNPGFPITAPAPPAGGNLVFTATDTETGQSGFVAIGIDGIPTTPTSFTVDNSNYQAGSGPANLNFSWITQYATSVTLSGPTGTTTTGASGASLPAPTSAGDYTYSVTATGGCGNAITTAAATLNVHVSAPPPPVPGACGVNGNVPAQPDPTTLCTFGVASGFDGPPSGPWSWTCSGSGGGSNATCSAAVSTCTSTTGQYISGVGSCATPGGDWEKAGTEYRLIGDRPSYPTYMVPVSCQYGLSIPPNATNLTLSVEWFAISDKAMSKMHSIGLSSGGSVFATKTIDQTLCGPPGCNPTTGSSSDNWGGALTPALLNNSFGVVFTYTPVYDASAHTEDRMYIPINLGYPDNVTVNYDIPNAQDGACGTANGSGQTTPPTAPSEFCSSGAMTGFVANSGPIYSWSCSGSCGGAATSCSTAGTAPPPPPPPGGVCGSSACGSASYCYRTKVVASASACNTSAEPAPFNIGATIGTGYSGPGVCCCLEEATSGGRPCP